MPTLHVALDESGDFEFSSNGSPYLIFTAAYTFTPDAVASKIQSLRFGLMKRGADLPTFHCCTDLQEHRNQVVAILRETDGWQFASVVVEKRKINPTIRPKDVFYPKFVTSLMRFILKSRDYRNPSNVVVCMDRLFEKKKADPIKALIKKECHSLAKGAGVWVYTHPKESNNWIQVADYCAWGITRKWRDGDCRTYNALGSRQAAPELDLCSLGDQTTYY